MASPGFAKDEAQSPPEDLSDLSIEELAQIQVRSVSKRGEPLSDAPASLFVIDHDQIVRSGAASIPEILRLAPNLQVYQQSPSKWVVTARGLNGLPSAQSFSNKLLVLVDGRTVYTPLFSGVYWDLPDLLPDDIERVEVISGPGATLWGANAVNGVINIITRDAGSVSGAFVEVQGGPVQQIAGVRIAGQAGKNLAYRIYARALRQDAARIPGGDSAEDSWHRLGGGFRLDWTASERDRVTFQGDIFDGREDEPGPASEDISGRNLVVRWNRDTGQGQGLQVQAFFDRIRRGTAAASGSFYADTYDLDLQHSFQLTRGNNLVWGGGARVVNYRIDGTPNFFFAPDSRDLFLANLFIQDTLALSQAFSVTAGFKAEHDPYVGFTLLPSLRLALKPAASTLLWAAVSRAVRSPTPFDEDVQERVPGLVSLSGNRQFRTEKLIAYEIGLRTQPLSRVSFSATGFYHDYDDLRTVELGPGPGFNIYWGNGLAGRTYGLETWASLSPLPWWTLSAGGMLLREQFHFKSGTAGLLPTWQNGVDPQYQLNLRSSMNLGRSVLFDLDFRTVGKLQHTDVRSYAELGGRLAWVVSDHLALTITGANLLHPRHLEYPGSDAIPRKVLAGLQWHP